MIYYAPADGAEVARIDGGVIRLSAPERLRDLSSRDLADLVLLLLRQAGSLARILDADEDEDGHEMIHALRDARALLGRAA